LTCAYGSRSCQSNPTSALKDTRTLSDKTKHADVADSGKVYNMHIYIYIISYIYIYAYKTALCLKSLPFKTAHAE